MISECKIKGMDLIFVMDESSSIGKNNFDKMKQFAINITDRFMISPNGTQVGWINFDHESRVIFNLSTYENKSSLHGAIREIDY